MRHGDGERSGFAHRREQRLRDELILDGSILAATLDPDIAGAQPIAHKDLVALLLEEAQAGSVRFVDWPIEQRRIDIGSFYSDSSRFMQATGWQPKVELREGFRRTLAFYREHLAHYVEATPPTATPVGQARRA